MASEKRATSIDLIGAGKLAEAIPDEVYIRTADVAAETFLKLTAPLTEATAGLGRYLGQKFDNLVAVEKALASFAIEKAVDRAKRRARRAGVAVHPPVHPKTFVSAIEQVAKETNPDLHEMWVNLIAGDISDNQAHPYFVQILSHFSPDEARILRSLRSIDELGGLRDHYLGATYDGFETWVPEYDAVAQPWTLACVMLCNFQLSQVAPPKEGRPKQALLYRTDTGSAFLQAVSES